MVNFVVTVKTADGSHHQEVVEASEWEVQGGALLLFARLGPKHLVKGYGPTGWVSFVTQESVPADPTPPITE